MRNPFAKAPQAPAHRLQPGDLYEGPACYTTDYSMVDKPGFYALDPDTASQLLQPLVRLTMVDDAPGIADDGACHLEIAGDTDPPQKAGKLVPLAADVQGTGNVETSR